MLDYIKKNLKKTIITAMLLLISIASVIGISNVKSMYPDQQEYIRWRGDNDMEFAQVSCFVPQSDKFIPSSVNTFRSAMVKAFNEASLDTENKLFVDCWSTKGSCTISSDKKYTTAPVYAVGGEFFDFHIMNFTSGTYFTENSVQRDGVILDENLAWFLFGSTEVVGLTVKIDETLFYITGVIKMPEDFASKKANTDEMLLFMPYESYSSLKGGDVQIGNYEVVLPDPVKNFAINLVKEKFPAKSAIINNVTDRFSYSSLFKVLKNFSARAMGLDVPYPAWENAVRYAESICSFYLFLFIVNIAYPSYLLVVHIIKQIKKIKTCIDDDYLPKFKDSVEERIRVRQRARWEKKHPGMK